jgi:hypothetical protein
MFVVLVPYVHGSVCNWHYIPPCVITQATLVVRVAVGRHLNHRFGCVFLVMMGNPATITAPGYHNFMLLVYLA